MTTNNIRNTDNASRSKYNITKVHQKTEFYARLLQIILDLTEITCRQGAYGLKFKNYFVINQKINDIAWVAEVEFPTMQYSPVVEIIRKGIGIVFLPRESTQFVVDIKARADDPEREFGIQNFCICIIRSHL